ncbi:MAG: hypothetical protein KAV87_33570 [Desulfobacteraceae bacterium]|nr:hypothetical protein [Desulfobacteraceae bacterium]
MSLDSYEELKVEIIEWSHRDDLDGKIDTFIDMAESEMYANQDGPLQLRGEETLAAFTMDSSTPSRFIALPTGYQSMRKIRVQIVDGESVELEFRTPSQLNILSSDGLPRFFTVTDQIELDRLPDQDYAGEIQYFQDFTPLSDTVATNTVLTNHPNIYLFGALWALKLHTEEAQAAANYYQQFISAIRGANNKDELGRYGPAPVMRVEGATP